MRIVSLMRKRVKQQILQLHQGLEERQPQVGVAVIKADGVFGDTPIQIMFQLYMCG